MSVECRAGGKTTFYNFIYNRIIHASSSVLEEEEDEDKDKDEDEDEASV